MANTKISQLTANTNPNGNEEFVYAYNNANGKITLDTVKTYIGSGGGSYTAGTGIDITSGVISNTGVVSVNGQTGNVIVSGGGGQVEYDYSAMQGPCSTGYHIPSQGEWQALYNAGITMSAWTSSGIIEWRTYLKIPPTGVRRYSDGDVSQQINQLHYWTYIPYQTEDAYSMTYVGGFNLAQHTHRANAVMIRPFKDTPAIPDVTRTTLYDGSGTAAGAGIFHKPGLGLISISADGETWITIADKNLGATVVYNHGDALAETNVGTYFQWGNNYGFAYTGAITTSSTQVDASTYGPGNYYTGSSFIKGNSDWSSVQNDNLRGGVTGPIPSGGGTSIVELSGDANIWELSEGEYITTHKLFYKSGSRIMPQGQEENYKTYIRVIEDGATSDDKGYFAINIDNNFTYGESSMWFGSSTSSSIGTCYPITDCTYMLKYYNYSRIPQISGTSMQIGGGTLGYQCENNLSGSYTLNTYGNNTYIGMEHYIFIPAQTNNYTIAADGLVDNPFNVTLPSNTNKACLIKFFCTGVSSMIITDCKIYS